MLSDWKKELETLEMSLADLRVSLDVAKRRDKISALETEFHRPDLWDDPVNAQKIMQELSLHQGKVKTYEELKQELEETSTLWQLAVEEDDVSLEPDIEQGIEALKQRFEALELELLLSGPYDRNNAILTLHAGAGGTEAQDWVQMLYRLYIRWGERHGYKVETLDFLHGEEAGIKSATLSFSGENAYGYAKSEKGVHRLVRISPFDASGRRHTSFASVDVIPEVAEDNDEIPIDAEDLRIDTYRSGGAGGQHVNKTDSAIRITHLPTGIVVQCQSERSQTQNKAAAMRVLQAKLLELKRKEQEAEISEIRGEQQEIAWGSQIRSYVFHPYSLVKDHRTNVETGNVSAVMDGEIDAFIAAFLQKTKTVH
ncbi:peptide chain release factor 2 [Desulfosporosinus youngiae]|uniref:Peptide chain release factor 2 n=1 Tax=Desulfosporosinus youngiae DSM 17734 TaxID=768710 RepID=H5Y0H9_9FIRM|nr:peptide chain release factor 2 [Desulfosporosinus youngiae]EHQ92235.1 peptide chain release factor 2 [Desulfosporosinus youngiae DSM 17734]